MNSRIRKKHENDLPERLCDEEIELKLHGGGSIVMHAEVPKEEISLDGFRQLLCLAPEHRAARERDVEYVSPGTLSAKGHTLFRTMYTEITYTEDWSRILIAAGKASPPNQLYYRNQIWKRGLIFAGMNALLRGEKAVLVHCTALETDRGVVLLFGESGMGKSTASARWRAHGGKCVSDDMALLDLSGGETVYVRRMPTWSACRMGKNEWNYPAGEELPLIGVLALGRNESGTGGDKIVKISPAQYYAQCYRSMFYWNLLYADKLPEEMQQRMGDRIRALTNIITGKYPPWALLTVLEGNPIPVIESYLESLEAR